MSSLDMARIKATVPQMEYRGVTDDQLATIVAEVGRQIACRFDEGGWREWTPGRLVAEWTGAKMGVCHRQIGEGDEVEGLCINGCGHPWAIHDDVIGCVACDYLVTRRSDR